MSYVLLKREAVFNPNAPNNLVYTVTEWYFDNLKRRPFATQYDSQVDNPFELTKGDEVYRYDFRPGQTRLVKYSGNGSVYTQNLTGPNPTPGNSAALKLKVNPQNATITDDALKDGSFDLTGQFGVPPYQLEVTGQGDAAGYHQTATSQLEIYPVRFYNIGKGGYFLKVTDATGATAFQLMNVVVGQYGAPRGTVLFDRVVNGRLIRRRWLFNELRTNEYSVSTNQGNGDFTIPYGTLVDAYLLPGGATWRQVYAGYQVAQQDDGKEVYFVDTSTETKSTLALHNLILFNPDSDAEQNGGCIVEITGGVPPLAFTLQGGVTKTDTRGRFDELAAGQYTVTVRDSLGASLVVPVELKALYRQWKYLAYDDLDSTPMRLEFWRRGYMGEAAAVYCDDKPVVLKSDGLSSALGGQGDIPSVVGRSAQINLLEEPNLFEEVVIGDDRMCRVDYYYNGRLEFRGYLKPDIYSAPLLDGRQLTSLVATDGLADLKDADMLGHVGQRLGGHRPVLHTLLHCLSRCQISLPVRIYTNRRDSAMATVDAPEELATTNRTGYWDEEKNEPADQRTVVDALTQLLGGTLVQRGGAWEIRSALEAALDAPGRAYQPAGTPVGDVVAYTPTGTILPPGPSRWHWLLANQRKQTRSGWKSLTGSTDAGWLENAFWPGNVFSDPYAWLDDYQRLRGTSGWFADPGVQFPLVLQRVGEKGKDHSTLWPRSGTLNGRDGRWLNSPTLPLAAGLEAVPAVIRFTGKFVPTDYYVDTEGVTLLAPSAAKQATLPYELVIDGHATGVQLATFDLAKGSEAKDTTFEAPLAALPSGALSATLRVYTWLAADTGLLDQATDLANAQGLVFVKDSLVKSDFGTGGNYRLFIAKRDFVAPPLTNTDDWFEVVSGNASSGELLITSVAIQLQPQNATWDGEDNFRADGPGGNVRPTEVLKTYHPDVPISAGLFSNNLDAFGKGVGLLDNTMTTSWARAVDKNATPLFEANTLDSLALRANPSRLLMGTIRSKSVAPPLLLDTIDTPFDDTHGRRFLVASATWDTKAATVDVSVIEIGKGADAEFTWPDGARITHRSYPFSPGRYLPYIRVVRGGIRVRHG